MVARHQSREQRRAAEATAQDRATARAHSEAKAGNVPILVEWLTLPEASQTTWVVGSRTTTGAGYVVMAIQEASGILRTACECDAATFHRACWHRAIVRLAIQEECRALDIRPELARIRERHEQDQEGIPQ